MAQMSILQSCDCTSRSRPITNAHVINTKLLADDTPYFRGRSIPLLDLICQALGYFAIVMNCRDFFLTIQTAII